MFNWKNVAEDTSNAKSTFNKKSTLGPAKSSFSNKVSQLSTKKSSNEANKLPPITSVTGKRRPGKIDTKAVEIACSQVVEDPEEMD
jgi:hypothetical protein